MVCEAKQGNNGVAVQAASTCRPFQPIFWNEASLEAVSAEWGGRDSTAIQQL